MSVDYTSFAVIGCEIPVTSLEAYYLKRNCDHQIPDGAVYCPTCGKKVSQMTKTVPQWYSEHNRRILSPNKEIVPNSLDVVFCTDEKRCFAGISISADDAQHATSLFIPPEIKTQVRNILESVGLWDESKYGLWAVQYCSY